MCIQPIYVNVERIFDSTISPGKRFSLGKKSYCVPCGKCPECRNLRRLQWTFRLEQESLQHSFNYFITLTYSNKYLPNDGQIYKPDFQEFIKRLRRRVDYHYSSNFKYFGCGEYGDQLGRCHFHAIIFSDCPLNFEDIISCWSYGFVKIASFTSNRAAYVVKYSQKSLFVDYSEDLVPPCSLASQGLGMSWLSPEVYRFYKATLNTIVHTFNGTPVRMPRCYFKKIYNAKEQKFINDREEFERWRKQDREFATFGACAVSNARFHKIDVKWQNAFDNMISKTQFDFHYEEVPVY